MRQTFRHIGLLPALLALALPLCSYADNIYDDDIYYNPKNQKSESAVKQKKSSKSAYIADYSNIDPDIYNRRGQYYATPIDTIGVATANGEDFVYTQEIQKYYNPTIVVEKSDIVDDILQNSYGNVEVVYNINGIPSFSPWFGYYSPIYTSNWSLGIWGPSWSWSWNWGPSWSIGWGPSWTWGPSWGWGPAWGWGPSWGWGPNWGPSWGPAWGPNWDYRPGWQANYRPNGRRPGGAGGNWAHNTRPGDRRPGGNYATSSGGYYNPSTRPGTSGNVGTGSNGNHSVSNPTVVMGADGHRRYQYNTDNGSTIRPSSPANQGSGNSTSATVSPASPERTPAIAEAALAPSATR